MQRFQFKREVATQPPAVDGSERNESKRGRQEEQQSRFQKVLTKVSKAVNAPFQNRREQIPVRRRENILRRCDSMMICRTNNELRREFPDMDISPRIIFDHPSIEGISQQLCEDMSVCSSESLCTERDIGDSSISSPRAPASALEVGDCIETGTFPTAWPTVTKNLKLHPFTQFVLSESDPIQWAMSCKQECTPLYEPTCSKDVKEPAQSRRYFRNRDGMECVLVPAAVAAIGANSLPPFEKEEISIAEGPCHCVQLSSFLIDIEPVSVGAYARFLNATRPSPESQLDWCQLLDGDDRDCHLPLYRDENDLWQVRPGVPLNWPMILVSWYGANAYSLWVHGHDWRDYRNAELSFLPTEAQWEYAARGADSVLFPWGDAPACPELLNVCWDMASHDQKASHISTPLEEFPLAPVNAELGVSPFGIRGMAGNVWQWCRDTYDPTFYQSPEASSTNAWNRANEWSDAPKVEKGGSWVGPADLARSSYRRGRLASAKGRCLGFRCVYDATKLQGLDEEYTEDSTATPSDGGSD